MATMYYERDCNLSLLDGKKVAVIGTVPRVMHTH